MISRFQFLATLPGLGFLRRWSSPLDQLEDGMLVAYIDSSQPISVPAGPLQPDDYIVFAERYWIGERSFYRLADAMVAAESGDVIMCAPGVL